MYLEATQELDKTVETLSTGSSPFVLDKYEDLYNNSSSKVKPDATISSVMAFQLKNNSDAVTLTAFFDYKTPVGLKKYELK